MREFSYEEIEAATGGFAAKNVVGKGSHGCVYRAKLKVGGGGGRRVIAVAVKRASHPQGEAKLANEIAVLTAARHHPGVVSLVGLVAMAGPRRPPLLVMELMPNGSLHDLLHRSPRLPAWPRRVQIALDVALAVRALHGAAPRVIIHRDVKTANILLARDGRARLADFSLAVTVSTEGAGPGPTPAPVPAGTMGYLDPSYTEPGRLGPESDVFSFGVVLLELVSGRKVMDVNASPSSIVAWAVPLIRAGLARKVFDKRVPAPPRGEGAEAAVARVLAVAARCVSESVERRPAMAEVVSELQAALESAGWRHHGHGRDVVGRAYRRVASWGTRVRVKMRRSRVECTEQSGSSSSSEGSRRAAPVTADSCPPPTLSRILFG
ncbi:serine/threonine-protein kinase-like protein At1g28390 [Brachypodium distachyon]|uniref:non-specific serine/threonine protein kinase n=1 Tax=Brachypodium distachyon TaxID=15368 RepID=I1HEA9_BRADI|nr:serine/threonine-protein kinase-like protein At1g28390 [Brachypodium distachyon]KQK03818.2 hypothetical protein BRADI_2g10000v3 [Brachypodium distachyon]|eukprot:XP_003565632.1 serine/threonine-protein kinase-like protein At1g28390 [Brachypodium distachyon]